MAMGGNATPAKPHICSFYQETQYLFQKASSRLAFMTQSLDLGHMATSSCKGNWESKNEAFRQYGERSKEMRINFYVVDQQYPPCLPN